ncbi:MAG: hypothetical protein A2Z88_06880 [Omnitrophica WOR_2 bacterium GWA2_47_8]|nr:MAG: hypothetical protein A2Z88_06880 [Omnitrophica WOR_2 bacterium GWA2_47_8]
MYPEDFRGEGEQMVEIGVIVWLHGGHQVFLEERIIDKAVLEDQNNALGIFAIIIPVQAYREEGT